MIITCAMSTIKEATDEANNFQVLTDSQYHQAPTRRSNPTKVRLKTIILIPQLHFIPQIPGIAIPSILAQGENGNGTEDGGRRLGGNRAV